VKQKTPNTRSFVEPSSSKDIHIMTVVSACLKRLQQQKVKFMKVHSTKISTFFDRVSRVLKMTKFSEKKKQIPSTQHLANHLGDVEKLL